MNERKRKRGEIDVKGLTISAAVPLSADLLVKRAAEMLLTGLESEQGPASIRDAVAIASRYECTAAQVAATDRHAELIAAAIDLLTEKLGECATYHRTGVRVHEVTR